MYAFYADVFWLNQFLLNAAALLLAGDISRQTDRHMPVRALAASAIGAALGVAVILIFRSYYAYLIFTYGWIIPLMTFLGFGREPPRLWLEHLGCCFGTTLLLGGLVYALENMAGIAQIPFLTAVCSFLLARVMIRKFLRRRRISQLLVPVTLTHRGCRFNGLGLIDTGNLLHEPYTGKPVHMLSPDVMTQLEINQLNRDDFLGLVPCRTVSSSDGLLEIYRIDCLSVTGSDKTHVISDAVIAKAPAELFKGKEYQLILHSECLDDVQ